MRKGGWWHYSRTVEGQQYAVHCRRAVRPGEVTPPIAEDGKPLDGEEVLLDGNELAAGDEFFSLGAFRTSPDQRWLAYSTDFAGDERFTLRIKDLATGATLPDEIPDTYYGCAWSLDGSAAVLRRRWTTPGVRTGSGGTGSAPPPPTTSWSSRRPTSASTSGSA